MNTKIRTVDFLPEIFRTDSNSQFLSATLDVLVNQSDLARVQGYIGTDYGYGIKSSDKYVVEPTKSRTDYQLDPSVIFLKKDTQSAIDFINYPSMLRALDNKGAKVDNANRLFSNEFYSWDPFIDYDKIVNYSQYYWLPFGPDSIPIVNRTLIAGTYNLRSIDSAFQFTIRPDENPSLGLVRGNTYTFVLESDDPEEKFYIQGVPGLSAFQGTTDTRLLYIDEISYETLPNGKKSVTFTVPSSDIQNDYIVSGNLTVDLVSTLTVADIDGRNVSEIYSIDEITDINEKTLLFYNGDNEDSFYTINVNNGVISLTKDLTSIPLNTKITINSGVEFAGQQFFRNSDEQITQVPYLYSIQDVLYYQSSKNSKRFGSLHIYDSNVTTEINIDDILDKKTYVSPNGIKFTNGLKVKFDDSVIPNSYANKEYYVEGVGDAIKLLPTLKFRVTELSSEIIYNLWDDIPWDMNNWDSDLYESIKPDYITINRHSRDYNAWTRSNRWFHQSVIDTTINALGYLSARKNNVMTRALRPIIEFRGNLQLLNGGKYSLGFITYIDTTITSVEQFVIDNTKMIDGFQLLAGDRVVFANATNRDNRKNVYVVSYNSDSDDRQIFLNPDASYQVTEETEIHVKYGNNAKRGTTWRWIESTEQWVQLQRKITVNQPPLFDIVNDNDISFANTNHYPNTNFAGTKLFSYTPGVGAADQVLGFPLAYSSLNNIADINFTVNYNGDVFSFTNQDQAITLNINSGYVKHNLLDGTFELLTGWVSAAGDSYQKQVFKFEMNAGDSMMKINLSPIQNTVWEPFQIYIEDRLLDSFEYTYTVTNNVTTVVLVEPLRTSGVVTVAIYSNSTDPNSYYIIPTNLSSNPFNDNIVNIDLGDIRNQYKTIYSNTPGISGVPYGINNIHDLGKINQYGTSIVQNSASLVLPGIFLRKPDINFFDALQFNSDEYYNYKTLLVEIANKNDYSIEQTPQQILDNIIYEITTIKNKSNTFFWTDMLYSGSPYVTNTYKFNTAPEDNVLQLSKMYDFTSANYSGLGVYLTRTASGSKTTRQLIRDIDYVISDTDPAIRILVNILAGDSITIYEYNQTYGSYCPSTPTKLGLYPAYVPTIYHDEIAGPNVYYIVGHDGSYNKLYGTYENNKLNDFRDIALLEFETRIYNNLKINSDSPLTADDVFPGQFRKTEYAYEEINDMHATNFLNWVGSSRVDFKKQYYRVNNRFSYNYNQSSNKLSGGSIKQGNWRGIYRWLYDTDRPHTHPWELLGLTIKPQWWDSRYGPAPYTSDNSYMWKEIADGYVWNNGQPYVDSKKVRSKLLSILPVDSSGKLVSPFVTIVGNYNQLTFNNNWNVGDCGPAESAYLHSSSWPFDLMKILALTKPAKFFNLMVDRDRYVYDDNFKQYLYDKKYHLDCRKLELYGNGQAKHSYINWVIDYVNVKGLIGHDVVTDYIRNIDVRLTYNLGGFSSKEYLKFYIERATPNSKNTSFLIPDESYTVLLYDNIPEETIQYSSVIFQKVKDGWTVWGNNQSKNYFTTLIPREMGQYSNIEFDNRVIRVSKSWYDKTQIVTYGTVFYSIQAVADFINNYGQYLTKQGVVFDTQYNNVELNWELMIREFMAWAYQDWEVGSTIALNPNSRKFTINREGVIVQPMTVNNNNYILNQNLIPIQNENSTIYRNEKEFTVRVTNAGDTIGFTSLQLNSVEHAVVFDNVSIFNDVIYNLKTELRQPRLLLKGYKTNNWSGYLDARGFILNENNVKQWEPGVKYPKGQIVLNKNLYWSATKLIEPQQTFNSIEWKQIDYERVKTGLLRNPSTDAYESTLYYDSNRSNLKLDENLLAFSLIGYRPRDYLSSADLSDITQINVFKNIVTEKGTLQVANAFKNVKFDQGSIDYTIRENWAINTGTFGNILSSNFVEFKLDQNALNGNPTLIGFSDNVAIDDAHQTVKITDIINYERPPVSSNFLPQLDTSDPTLEYLPSAGYVDMRDADYAVYEFDNLNEDRTIIDNVKVGDTIWIAKYKHTWQIYTVVGLQSQCVEVTNNKNGTIIASFNEPHGLTVNQHFTIGDFNNSVDGFYTVKEIKSNNSVIAYGSLDSSIVKLSGLGISTKLVSLRHSQPSDVINTNIQYSEFRTKNAWVDNDKDNHWAVYSSSPVFVEKSLTGYVAPNTIVSTVEYNDQLGVIYAAPAENKVFYYKNDVVKNITISSELDIQFGKILAVASDKLFVGSLNKIYYYKLNTSTNELEAIQILNTQAIDLAASVDGIWLYVAKSSRMIDVYHLNRNTNSYVKVDSVQCPNDITSVVTSVDGSKVLCASSTATISNIDNVGQVFVFNRIRERYVADGVSREFNTHYFVPSNTADVYDNGVLISSNNVIVNESTITLRNIPNAGKNITVEYGKLVLSQTINSPTIGIGARFGQTIDVNRYGATFIVGSPYEIIRKNTNNNSSITEGAVYVYTNSGQRYAHIKLINPVVGENGVIFINGYKVLFPESGTNNLNVISQLINNSTPTNVVATVVDNTIEIGLRESTDSVPYNNIDLVGDLTVLTSLNYAPYSNTQKITSPNSDQSSRFGFSISMNERDSIVIGAPTASMIDYTTFDVTKNCQNDNTTFDNDITTFIDITLRTGMAYAYEYLPAHNESIENPGQYAFGQYIKPTIGHSGYSTKSNFAIVVKHGNNTIVSGSQNWINSRGSVFLFNSSTESADPCHVIKSTTWYVNKKPINSVDINKINNISIYSTSESNFVEYLDYIDPLRGKLFGALSTNIDIVSEQDPAGYDSVSLAWSSDRVGTIWLNPTNLRLMNYQQPDAQYNSRYWGVAFSGSSADIYTWIESDVIPLNYSGTGFPMTYDKYATASVMNDATNSLTTKYYFWVKNYSEVPKNKTLSPIALEQYLLNPQSSGISYLAPISTNMIALYNSEEYIRNYDSIMHLGYGNSTYDDNKHYSWKLISTESDDNLTGIPDANNLKPSGLYLKYIDSFAGIDSNNLSVPDTRLPEILRYGVGYNPRQSMFIDRRQALKNYVEYANKILAQYPITETRTNLSLLKDNGIGYDVRNYWTYINWWAAGYSNEIKAAVEVNTFVDLLSIGDKQLITGSNGLVLTLSDGLIVKVKLNSSGLSEYYIYDNLSWTRIGLERGTIQISDDIYIKNCPKETRNVIRWIVEQLYTQELRTYRNSSLMLMFNYIISETNNKNNYNQWLVKTSLVDVKHKIRSLLQYSKYQRENKEFLFGYFNEVKPYHVYVKDFIYSYDGSEVLPLHVTDFDLPAKYNFDKLKFISPKLKTTKLEMASDESRYESSSDVWKSPEYSSWYQNFGLSLSSGVKSPVAIAITQDYIEKVDQVISISNFSGLHDGDVVIIDDEQIYVGKVDRYNGVLTDLIRGYNSTVIARHEIKSIVYIPSSNIIMINRGRGYSTDTIATIDFDTTKYLSPRQEIILTPQIANGEMNSIAINNPGSGYVAAPNITLSSSTISVEFSGENIRLNNVINKPNHKLKTGDSVVYTIDDELTDYGLKNNEYYYVFKIDDNNFALYRSNSHIQRSEFYQRNSADKRRVKLNIIESTVIAVLTIAARVQYIYQSYPIRTIKTKIKFDRTGYTTNHGWDADNWDTVVWDFEDKNNALIRIFDYYNPSSNMTGIIPEALMTGLTNPSVVKGPELKLTSDEALDKADSLITNEGFTNSATDFIINGGKFSDGYSPEELVAGYLTDRITITVKDESNWKFTIEINDSGKMTVLSNSGVKLKKQYLNYWWYNNVNYTIGQKPPEDMQILDLSLNEIADAHPTSIANFLRS
jgi:hypothetical protein